jgi:hypothetical protein
MSAKLVPSGPDAHITPKEKAPLAGGAKDFK